MFAGAGDGGRKLLAAFGVQGVLADGLLQTAELKVFPENRQPLEVFSAMQTQWRTGMAGATGLDYTALPAVLKLCGVKLCDRADVFGAVRVMEAEALRIMAARRR